MTVSKRIFDLVVLVVLAPVLLPMLLVAVLVTWAAQGRPIFYGGERMRDMHHAFTLWKLRSMTEVAQDSGVSGGDKIARITPIGRIMRRSRMDELPQLLNIARGDISFVGPRPPLRQYVERFPAIYTQTLRNRPGVTSIASLLFAEHEPKLLSRCLTAEQTDDMYARVFAPRKARVDLIYQRHQSLGFDLWLIIVTAMRVLGLWRKGRFPRGPQIFRPRDCPSANLAASQAHVPLTRRAPVRDR